MDDRLDQLLSAARPAFPPTPDLAAGVVTRLGVPGRSSLRTRLRGPRLALALAVLLGLIVGAGAVAAGAFGVGPLRILFTTDPLPSAAPLGSRLGLGERVSLDEALRGDGPALLAPESLGPPDEAYRSAAGIVTMLWRAGADLPAIGTSDVALLVMAIPGDLDPDLVTKVVVESRATLEPVVVRGRDGFWISGAPHLLRYFDPSGADATVTSRLVGDALVWDEGGTVYRIETDLGRDRAIGFAEEAGPLE
jgi:hypothetical protein